MEILFIGALVVIGVGITFGIIALSVQRDKVASLGDLPGFTPYVQYDGQLGGYGLALDPSTNQFAIFGVGVPPKVYRFD